jgi:hypothetical protein
MQTKIFILLLSLSINAAAQNTKPNILRKVYADKAIYVYGEIVQISIRAINTAPTQDTLSFSDYIGPYPYVDGNDYLMTFSLGSYPDSTVLVIPADDSIEWKYDYPHKSKPEKKLSVGQHSLFGYFRDRYPNTDTIDLYVKQGTGVVGKEVFNLAFSLAQNYPNPFNPSTIISFQLEKESFVSLKIYDLMGREVETLIQSEISNGSHTIEWIPKNISSGVYYYRILTEDCSETKKLMFTK